MRSIIRHAGVIPLRPGSPSDDVVLAAFDTNSQRTRRIVCRAITSVLSETSSRLRAAGHTWNNDNINGLGLMISIAAELSSSAIRCLDHRECYASAALVRQIVEVQYFMWTFAESRNAGRDWLKASSTVIRQNFKPDILRKKSHGVFDDAEYWRHCDMGGHPNPAAQVFFGQDADQSIVVELTFADLAQHLERIWNFFLTAMQLQSVSSSLQGESLDRTMEAIHNWHAIDALSTSLRTQVEPNADP